MNRHGWSIRPWTCGERGSRATREDVLELLPPAAWMRREYLAYIEEFQAMGSPSHGDRREEAICDFGAMLSMMQDAAAGCNLPADRVPQTEYWLFRRERLVGTCRLRHCLNDVLREHGGHIGYDIRPSEWGNGFATRMLAMVLEKARTMGLGRVMLTCDRVNGASAKVIHKNGGHLEREYPHQENGHAAVMQRYWIDL